MGNKVVQVEKVNTNTKIFSGKVGLYKGNLIKIEDWASYKNVNDFRIVNHFGVMTLVDKYVMYAFYTTKLGYYQGNGIFYKVNNFKCERGIYSYINHPICAEIEDFNQYVECSNNLSDYPSYVKTESGELISNIESDALYNYKLAYINAISFNKIYIKEQIHAEILGSDITIAGSSGILNHHNSAFYSNAKIDIKVLELINISLMSELNNIF